MATRTAIMSVDTQPMCLDQARRYALPVQSEEVATRRELMVPDARWDRASSAADSGRS